MIEMLGQPLWSRVTITKDSRGTYSVQLDGEAIGKVDKDWSPALKTCWTHQHTGQVFKAPKAAAIDLAGLVIVQPALRNR